MNKVVSKICLIVAIFFVAGIIMSTAVTAENKVSGTNNQIVDTSININTATVKELSGLSGIGKKRAEAIIAYRTNHGNFSEINELRKVEGIGKKTFERIKGEIAVN